MPPCRGLGILALGSCHSPEAIFSLLGPFSTWRLRRFFETLLSAARLSLTRPVALRPRLATGLPLSWTATQYTSNAQKRSQKIHLERVGTEQQVGCVHHTQRRLRNSPPLQLYK